MPLPVKEDLAKNGSGVDAGCQICNRSAEPLGLFVWFVLSVIICPRSFECVQQQLQQSIMGSKCIGCHVSWALPLSIYIVCHHLQSMAQCATCSHVLSLCMIWEKDACLRFAFVTSRGHLCDQHLTLAIFNREIMDLECLGKIMLETQKEKHLCPHCLCLI